MILEKHGLPVPSQDVIGFNLGVVVPIEEAGDFSPVRTGMGDRVGVGTQLCEPKYDFNMVAQRLGWGLRMTCMPPSDFSSSEALLDHLVQAEREDRDVAVCYDSSTIYGGAEGGHVNLFDRALPGGLVRLIEPAVFPGYKDYLWRTASPDNLLEAMAVHVEWMGGVWEIELT